MRLRDPRNASLLILATDTVVIALIVIVLVSLGAGFLIGYKISDWTKDGIPLLIGTQPKAPPVDSVSPADYQTKPQEAVPAPAPQEGVKEAAGAGAEPPAREQPTQAEVKPPATSPPPERRPEGEAQTRVEKPVNAAKAAREAQPKAGKPGGPDAKPAKATREASPAGKAPRDAGASADAGNAPGGTPLKVYTIQVGAFPQKAEAEQLRDTLTAKGFKAYVVNEGEQDPYHRVRVGKFRDKKITEQTAEALREKTGADPYILVTKP